MAYEFIREELLEARYLRTHRDAIGKSAGNLADGFFEHLLVLQQMRFENPAWAKKYAKDTLRFQSFTSIRHGATDLHNLAAIIANPSKFKAKVGAELGGYRFDELRFKRYLRDIASGRYNPSYDRAMFLQLQKGLSIKSSLLKQARRVIGDYGASVPNERKTVSTRLMNTFRQDGRFRSDLYKPYAKTVKNKDLTLDPKTKSKIPYGAKVAAAAVVGYKVGSSSLFN